MGVGSVLPLLPHRRRHDIVTAYRAPENKARNRLQGLSIVTPSDGEGSKVLVRSVVLAVKLIRFLVAPPVGMTGGGGPYPHNIENEKALDWPACALDRIAAKLPAE